MKRTLAFSLLVLGLASLAAAQYRPEQKFEISLFGGFGLTSVKGLTDYSFDWSALSLSSVQESTAIDAISKNAIFFGAGFAYYFTPNFGLGVSGGYLKATVDTTAAADFAWTWDDGRHFTKAYDWTGTDNSFSTIPISLNLIGRFGQGRIEGFVEAGPTLFNNSVTLDSALSFGITEVDYVFYPYFYTQSVDVLKIPLQINQKWTAIGADFGAGVTFMLSPSIGVNLEAKYYFCPKKTLDWTFILGTYNGLMDTISNFDFGQDSVDEILNGNHLTSIEINPSFFSVQVGLKIKI